MPLEGFYSRVELEVFEAPAADSTVPKCGACGLWKGCRSPKMPVAGKGLRKVLVVGEAPGRNEDRKNRPFVGDAGQVLQKNLAKAGFDLFRDAWVYNSIICRPPGNETPTDKQIQFCRPNVFNLIKELEPNVVVLLGNVPVKSVIGRLWKKNPESVTRWAGFRCPSQEINAWVCPTFHPSYVMREQSSVLDLIFQQHLKAAFSLASRPWKKVPDFASRVQSYESGDEAYKPLRRLLADAGRPLAWDLETNMIKPDCGRAQIVCCSVSDGRESVAFMWDGKAVRLMKEWLASDAPKYGANMKFEDRWIRKEFGFAVRGFVHDANLAAHVLDNRKLVSGVKFQAFAKLGQKEYDRHAAPYLKPPKRMGQGGYVENQIKKCPKKDLLQYCGMDSVIEALLAKVHLRELDDL